MAITLAQALLNANDAIDRAIIDEFLKSSYLLGAMQFDQAVSPGSGGTTLTYGYVRQITQRGADFRAINAEYTPTEVTKQDYATTLVPLGGSFEIDRVLDDIARSAETQFQVRELVKATRAKFCDAAVNGDVGEDANGFDGLSVALTGSSTEIDGSGYDWTAEMERPDAIVALAGLRRLIALLDGRPGAILTGLDGFLALQSLGQLTQTVQPLDGFGDTIMSYAGIPVVNMGEKPGSTDEIIPTTDGATDLYAVRFGLDGFHGVTVREGNLVRTWLPDFATAGAVKTGEVEMGPVSVVLKRTKAAGVLRDVVVSAGS